ncbi:MAG: AbrB/MazE/SpoVT family DNA-binding domain-containing protein [Candidatus Woesearchaeota archaeon]
MEVAITRISPNGQIVIPAEIRRDAGITTSTKFIVFNKDGNILLKQINKENLGKEIDMIQKIARSEEQIKKGSYVKANTRMKAAQIDALLTK